MMKPLIDDQQPIARIVGHRISAPVGAPPGPAARAAWNAMAAYRTRAPKGVFVYRSHEEMSLNRDQWAAAAVAHRVRERA